MVSGFFGSIYHLFCASRFEFHRIGGLFYLIQYFIGFTWYIYDFNSFKSSMIIVTLPLNGVLQSISASYYFRFLPKKQDPGYYSDKHALSHRFVVENVFYAGLLMFQWIYYSDVIKPHIPLFFEFLLVFLPYTVIRPFFPKTGFRDSLKTKNTSAVNETFYKYGMLRYF